jgi:5-methylcytosine-specific restriction endonuclease McrA
MKYEDQLQQIEWLVKRNQIIRKAGHKCSKCGDTEEPLQVHHRVYYSGRMAWEYPDNELVCLCVYCHEEIHDRYDIPRDEPPPVEPPRGGGLVPVSTVLQSVFESMMAQYTKAA